MELSDAGQQAVQKLAAALERRPPWPDAVLDDALAIIVLATAPLDELDPIEESILASFAARVAAVGGEGTLKAGDALARGIGAYFAKNPLPEALAKDMTAALKELEAKGNADKAVAALGAAQGAESKVPVNQRAPVDGAQRMGVMGRFAFNVKK